MTTSSDAYSQDSKLPDYVTFAIFEYGQCEFSDGTVQEHKKGFSASKKYRLELEAAIRQYGDERVKQSQQNTGEKS